METIYAPGYSEERLEREDKKREIGKVRLMKEYNAMIRKVNRLEKMEHLIIVLWFSCFPILLLYKIDQNPIFIFLAFLQLVLGIFAFFRIQKCLRFTEGSLE
jgi:hypothetical protein